MKAREEQAAQKAEQLATEEAEAALQIARREAALAKTKAWRAKKEAAAVAASANEVEAAAAEEERRLERDVRLEDRAKIRQDQRVSLALRLDPQRSAVIWEYSYDLHANLLTHKQMNHSNFFGHRSLLWRVEVSIRS